MKLKPGNFCLTLFDQRINEALSNHLVFVATKRPLS